MAEASKPIAFIVNDVPLSSSSYLIDTLNEYFPSRYLICHEHPLGGYSHYHFLVDFTEKQYNTYIKRIREKFNLRGKAFKGHRKQYGRIRKIEDLEKLKAYMLKDHIEGHYWCENYTPEDIQSYIDASFKKDAATELCHKVNKYVISNISNCTDNYKEIKHINVHPGGETQWSSYPTYKERYYMIAIEYHLINQIRINRTTLNNYYTEFLRTNGIDIHNAPIHEISIMIYNHLFNADV